MKPEHFRYAVREAARTVVNDYRMMGRAILGQKAPASKGVGEGGAGATASSSSSSSSSSASAPGVAQPPITTFNAPSAEEVRDVSIKAAKKLLELSRDQDFRSRVTAMSADALTLAKDSLDEFLLGYAEGKNEEIRAYVEEQVEKEQEFAERVRRIRAEIEEAHRASMAAAADATEAGEGGTQAANGQGPEAAPQQPPTPPAPRWTGRT
jgi:hypothetical protein